MGRRLGEEGKEEETNTECHLHGPWGSAHECSEAELATEGKPAHRGVSAGR